MVISNKDLSKSLCINVLTQLVIIVMVIILQQDEEYVQVVTYLINLSINNAKFFVETVYQIQEKLVMTQIQLLEMVVQIAWKRQDGLVLDLDQVYVLEIVSVETVLQRHPLKIVTMAIQIQMMVVQMIVQRNLDLLVKMNHLFVQSFVETASRQVQKLVTMEIKMILMDALLNAKQRIDGHVPAQVLAVALLFVEMALDQEVKLVTMEI